MARLKIRDPERRGIRGRRHPHCPPSAIPFSANQNTEASQGENRKDRSHMPSREEPAPNPGQHLRQEMPGMLGDVRQPHSHQRWRHAGVILGQERIVRSQWVVVKLPELLHSLSEKLVVARRSVEGPPNVCVAWDVVAKNHRDGAFRGRQNPLSRHAVVPQGHKAQNADRGREECQGRAPAPPSKEGPDDDCRDQAHSVRSDKRQNATEEARADRGSGSVLSAFFSHQCQADTCK
jgi:hypothetical protein